MENNILTKMYNNYLEKYKETGYHPHPANLLALLLLPEKDNYEPLKVCEGVFYKSYKEKIDEKISKVIEDFNITQEEIIAFIEAKGILTDDDTYEKDKIWFVFAPGFGIMHGEMMYRPAETDYQIYELMDNKKKLYKMTEEGLEEHTKTKGKNKYKILKID